MNEIKGKLATITQEDFAPFIAKCEEVVKNHEQSKQACVQQIQELETALQQTEEQRERFRGQIEEQRTDALFVRDYIALSGHHELEQKPLISEFLKLINRFHPNTND